MTNPSNNISDPGLVSVASGVALSGSERITVNNGAVWSDLTTQQIAALASSTILAANNTFTGTNIFSLMFQIPVTTVAASGTNQGTAALLTPGFQTVTASDGTKGVTLPTAPAAGTIVIAKNTVSNHVMIVYPDPAATINAIAANAAIFVAASCPAIFIASSATQWYTIPLLPS